MDIRRTLAGSPAVKVTMVLGATLMIVLGGRAMMAPSGADLPAAEELGMLALVHAAGGVVLDDTAFPGELPSFEQRYVGDAKSWEPTLGIGPDGTAYYMGAGEYVGETGVFEVDKFQIDRPQVWRSNDQGVSWTDVSPRLVYPDTLPADLSALTATPAQSGDPMLHVDPVTGRVFNYHQQAYVLCDHWATSADKGESWDQWDTCFNSLVYDESWGDHPTIVTGAPRTHATTGYPNVLYFCASNGCRASFDAGATWTEPARTDPCGEHQLGQLRTGPEGNAYLPHKDCGGARLAISKDDGDTWTTVVVDDTVWSTAGEAWEGWDHEAAVAADAAGNVYYFWQGEDRLPYLAVSTDEGTTWTAPIAVGHPDVTYSLFPKVVAGDAGRIAFMYWGTDVASASRDDPDAVWNVYVGVSLNALDADPVFATTTAHDADDPVRRGVCTNFRCYVDPGPRGDGVLMEGVYDFLDMQVSPATGDVWVALVDLCNDACAAPDGSADDPGLSRAAVGVQVTGTRLLEVA